MSMLVLIVDDNQDLCELLRCTVAGFGYDAITASDGDEALRLLRERHYDLVLSDHDMPRMSGSELAEMIAREFRTARPWFVMVSGRVSDSRWQFVDAAVRKPCDPVVLRRILDHVLATHPPDFNLDP